MTALAFAIQRPVPQAVEGFAGALHSVGSEQRRASTVDQEHSAVHISLLGDLAESPPLGTGAFTGSKPQPASEMTSGREPLDIAHGRAQRSTGQKTDAGNLPQLLHPLIRARKSCELALDAEHLLLER